MTTDTTTDTTTAILADFRQGGTRGKPQPIEAASLPDALLTVRTVGTVTALSPATIHRKMRSGQFPAPVRLGARCTRWKAADVRAWLAAQASLEPTADADPVIPADRSDAPGLSLRDHFAGQALIGLLSNAEHTKERAKNNRPLTGSWLAESAYVFADEMLQAGLAESACVSADEMLQARLAQ